MFMKKELNSFAISFAVVTNLSPISSPLISLDGRLGNKFLSTLHISFELPPAALMLSWK